MSVVSPDSPSPDDHSVRFQELLQTSAKRTKGDRLLQTGLVFLLAASIILFFVVVLNIERDDKGPFFMMGFFASGAVGVVLCICGLVRSRS